MARIRTIKPEFFRHEQLAELSALHRLLFIGLWTLADRCGRLEDRPKRIKVELLPYDSGDINRMLDALAAAGFIVRYVVGGARYIAIPSFSEHQRVTGKEATAPVSIPPPPDHTPDNTPGHHWGNTGEASETQPGHSGDHRKGKEYGKGVGEGKGEDAPAPASSVVPFDADHGAMPTRRRNPAMAWEGRREGLGVPAKLHADLLSRMAPPDEAALLAWYAETEQAWQGKAIGATCWQFWNARFAEWQGLEAARVALGAATTPKKPGRWAIDIDAEVARQREAAAARGRVS